MKILDTTNGRIHEYGSSPHDSLEISSDGCSLHYYNLQCGDGSEFGSYRFVMEDGKIPEESQTEDARYAECYFNIGGFGTRPHGELNPYKDNAYSGGGYWLCTKCKWKFSFGAYRILQDDNYCPHCGAKIRKEGEA